MQTTVKETIYAIIARQAGLGVDHITPDSTPDQLGLDSLGLVEIIFALEENFDISIPFNAGETGAQDFNSTTVGDIVSSVRSLISQKSGPP